MRAIVFSFLFLVSLFIYAEPWVSDLGNGEYKNPVLFADYSDPDLVKVGDDFYMVASSFNAMPGIPVLHSKDLVNWEIIGHVYERLPFEKFERPAHGDGSWAPSIRFHNSVFYVYFCTPNRGLFVATAKHPSGPWTLEHMVDVALWEDPSPLWDDDGNAYLVRSKVRADNLYLHRMSPDGKKLLDDGVLIYRNLDEQPVIEGPKIMKKDGWYYILAPAGGVPTGWQAVLRSKKLYGPYETKVVLHKGSTEINGPHQGGLVQLDSGEWWFMHFQDRDIYGRIAHLQPVHWQDGWPLMGEDINGDGIGEPVAKWKKPDVGKTWPIQVPQASDEFNVSKLGLQWQWHANPKKEWYSLNDAARGKMRLYAVKNVTQFGNLRFVPNLLLQKIAAPSLSFTTKITFAPDSLNDKSGLTIMGRSWGYIGLYKGKDGVKLGVFEGKYEQYDDATVEVASLMAKPSGKNTYTYYLKVDVAAGGEYQFSYSLEGKTFNSLGNKIQATAGVWIGAKVGLFSVSPNINPSKGYADFDWFRTQ
ncbi:glycoside hydrolase family 43 protein [Teredinibacter haidensis]|uniref:glycoside hydrolase family 43 protein n=1 Tax=Teredinibacter haidensis TaxID=2731755 RepID=UPI000A7CFC4A|nr:glycoside hydrolase 43 family protein [Teredinibacter haidensis]